MNILDIVVLIIIILLVLRGLWKGLIRQIMGIIGAVVAFIIAIKFSGILAAKYFTGFQPTTGYLIAFLVIFLACMIAESLLAALIGKFTTAVGLSYLNRIGGGLLGGAKGCFVMAAVILILVAYLPPKSNLLVESKTLKYILPMTDVLSHLAPHSIRTRYNKNVQKKERILNKLWIEHQHGSAQMGLAFMDRLKEESCPGCPCRLFLTYGSGQFFSGYM
jgi:membrane protein required for colicin V production